MTQAITVIPQVPANLPALTEVFYGSMVCGIDSWEPHENLSRNSEEEMAILLEGHQSEELMKNLESWNDLFSKKHHRMLIEKESLRLGITL